MDQDFYEALQRERPDMVDRVVFITGDTLSAEAQLFLNQTNALYIEKPFLPDDVLRLLYRAIGDRGTRTNGSTDRGQQVGRES